MFHFTFLLIFAPFSKNFDWSNFQKWGTIL